MKIIIATIILVLVTLTGMFILRSPQPPTETKVETVSEKPVEEEVLADFKNVTFTISGEPITLQDGVSTTEVVPGSASLRTVRYFGNELEKDIDGDGDLDMVFLVTDDGGGSGTFFYVVGAIKDASVYKGTQAMLLGDRIAPQTTESGEGLMAVVNYVERLPGEPMSTSPSVGKTMWLKYDATNNDFGEVVQNFEGESN